jgi:hypothetical protein
LDETNFSKPWRLFFWTTLVMLESQAPKLSIFECFVHVGYGIWIIIIHCGDLETRMMTMGLNCRVDAIAKEFLTTI